MRRALHLVLLALCAGCASSREALYLPVTASHADGAPSSPAEPSELDRNLAVYLRASKDPAYEKLRAQALTYLVTHPAAAHPRLVSLLEADPPNLYVVGAMRVIGWVDGIEPMVRAMGRADTIIAFSIGQLIAGHPRPEARLALEAALQDPREQVIWAVIAALAKRGDPASCPALDAAGQAVGVELRGEITRAMAHLACSRIGSP